MKEAKDEKAIKIGTYEKKEVTKVNNKLYLKAKDILIENQHADHIGWPGVGAFIDWLEENYNLTKKAKWQPIETAPADGTRVLVHTKAIGIFATTTPVGTWMDVAHWLPLPETPK